MYTYIFVFIFIVCDTYISYMHISFSYAYIHSNLWKAVFLNSLPTSYVFSVKTFVPDVQQTKRWNSAFESTTSSKVTHWKISTEPKKHPIEQEKSSSKPSFSGSILVLSWFYRVYRKPVVLRDPALNCLLPIFVSQGKWGGTLEMVPLLINPIYTLYVGYLLGISPIKGLLGGLSS